MSRAAKQKGWMRGLVEFALDQDVNREIDNQRRILTEHPRSAQAHFNLAVLHYSQGRAQEAILGFLEAIDCDPSFGRAYRKLGEVFVATGQYERAAWYARAAADLGDPTL